jgi:hypothetical protein
MITPSDPPPGFVAFVARCLDGLRDTDDRYGEVLTDVAVRWTWVRLLERLGRRDAPDACLRGALRRRSQRWERAEPAAADLSEVDIRVLPAARPHPPVARSSAATRLATQARPEALPVTEAAVIMEAAVAWWHAYEAYRRWLLVAGLVLVVGYFVAVVLQGLRHA